jgi:hypothetical protein
LDPFSTANGHVTSGGGTHVRNFGDDDLLEEIARGVRRAFLCGEGFEHRKQWIEDRLQTLSEPRTLHTSVTGDNSTTTGESKVTGDQNIVQGDVIGGL